MFFFFFFLFFTSRSCRGARAPKNYLDFSNAEMNRVKTKQLGLPSKQLNLFSSNVYTVGTSEIVSLYNKLTPYRYAPVDGLET